MILGCAAQQLQYVWWLWSLHLQNMLSRSLVAVGDMDDSDEKSQLINYVARLDSQLKEAGCPYEEILYVHLFRDLNLESLAKKLKLWRFRKELLREKLVASQLSRSTLSAASEKTAATSPPVIKQETERKRKFEEEVVSTIFTGNVHTALKRQASLRLLIQRVQRN
jgi:hypothetical protein